MISEKNKLLIIRDLINTYSVYNIILKLISLQLDFKLSQTRIEPEFGT